MSPDLHDCHVVVVSPVARAVHGKSEPEENGTNYWNIIPFGTALSAWPPNVRTLQPQNILESTKWVVKTSNEHGEE